MKIKPGEQIKLIQRTKVRKVIGIFAQPIASHHVRAAIKMVRK